MCVDGRQLGSKGYVNDVLVNVWFLTGGYISRDRFVTFGRKSKERPWRSALKGLPPSTNQSRLEQYITLFAQHVSNISMVIDMNL